MTEIEVSSKERPCARGDLVDALRPASVDRIVGDGIDGKFSRFSLASTAMGPAILVHSPTRWLAHDRPPAFQNVDPQIAVRKRAGQNNASE